MRSWLLAILLKVAIAPLGGIMSVFSVLEELGFATLPGLSFFLVGMVLM
ncbi:MAG: hypothetical protein AB7G62_00530 [Magnetospirillum sp.]